MERARVTRGCRGFRNGGLAIPAGDRLPVRFALDPIPQTFRNRIFELDAAFFGGPPNDGRHSIERTDDDEKVLARRRKIARIELSALGR